MSIFGGIGNIMNTASNLVTAVATGDLKGALMAAAQIGLMYMTGGSSALLTGAIQQGIAQFGGQMMAQALGKELVSMMGQELIQKLGTEMGLDQKVIDMAQAAFCKECGDMQGYQRNHLEAGTIGMGNGLTKFEQMSSKVFLQHILNGFDASPAQRGEAERAFDGVSSIMDKFVKMMLEEATGGSSEDKLQKAMQASKGKSLIMQIAMILGALADEKTLEMRDKAFEIGQVSNKYGDELSGINAKKQAGKFEGVKTKKDGAIAQLSAELQALGQELKTVTEAMTNAVKSLGESAATSARKS
ncbi:MAG: hypothetical protein ACRBEQ_14775 [Hyphomonas sp.]